MSADVKPTQEFKKFCLHLHQDVLILNSSLQEMIDYALKGLSEEERRSLASYFRFLVADDISDQDLERVWETGGSDLDIGSGAEIRYFLREALGRM